MKLKIDLKEGEWMDLILLLEVVKGEDYRNIRNRIKCSYNSMKAMGRDVTNETVHSTQFRCKNNNYKI
jgi:predicted DNA-binding antitoxin AbrB/MazE fold protein